jgi:hypothetical protein
MWIENYRRSYPKSSVAYMGNDKEAQSKIRMNIAKQLKNSNFQANVKKMLKAVCLRDDFF